MYIFSIFHIYNARILHLFRKMTISPIQFTYASSRIFMSAYTAWLVLFHSQTLTIDMTIDY